MVIEITDRPSGFWAFSMVRIMKNIYEVIAVKDRYVRGVKGSFKAEEGYVVYRAYQVAESADEAIESVKSYHMPAGTTYDSIRAEFVREA